MTCVHAHRTSEIDELINATVSNGGLAPVDLQAFWAEQDGAGADPFNAAQCALQVHWGPWCIWDELGLPANNQRYETDFAWARELNKQYNDISEHVVGRRLFNEAPYDPELEYPARKQLHDIFEAKAEWHADSLWLMPAAQTPEELKSLLDRVEQRLERLREFILPPDWDAARERLLVLGIKPKRYRSQRGPVTFAQSIYGTEGLIFLLMDEPALADRFSGLIQKAIIGVAELMDREAGYAAGNGPPGFGFNDDGCMFLTPEMYARFGYPICKAAFERFAPRPGDRRYHHSDSPMGHLLPVMAGLGLTEVNLGPSLTVSDIRKHLPTTVIDGQLDPATLERNDLKGLAAEFMRDFEQAQDTRGLRFQTSGVVNNGSRLTSLRFLMAVIQRWGKY